MVVVVGVGGEWNGLRVDHLVSAEVHEVEFVILGCGVQCGSNREDEVWAWMDKSITLSVFEITVGYLRSECRTVG